MTPRLVSVIIPTFNRARLVGQTLSCFVEQEYRPIDLIVVDDSSSDGTAEVVQRMIAKTRATDLSLRFVRLDRNYGAPYARNIGLAMAVGEYVLFNDSDDLIDPKKLRMQAEALDGDNTLDFVYGPNKILETGVPVFGAVELNPLQACIRQLRSPFFTTSGPMFRRSFLTRAGDWDVTLPCFQDWEYHLRLTYLHPHYKWLPNALAYYRSQGHEKRISIDSNGQVGRQQRVVGHYKRITSAINHAPIWTLDSARFRWSLRWNTYRVVALCLNGGSTDFAEDILAQLARKDTCATSREYLAEKIVGKGFSYCPGLFGTGFGICDFMYWRFHGFRGRVNRFFKDLDTSVRRRGKGRMPIFH